MIRTLFTAASGMRAGRLRVDNTSNNIANVNTPGYRKSQVDFADMLYQPAAAGRLLVGSGVLPILVTRDLAPGVLTETGSPLDLAIAGDGFFVVTGEGGEARYTRDGSFRVDGLGRIVNASGLEVRLDPAAGGIPPLFLPAEALDINVSAQGELTYRLPDSDETVVAGWVQVAVPVPRAPGRTIDMLPQGRNLYAPSVDTVMELRVAATDGTGAVKAGFLERSNVSLVDEVVDLIAAQRAYELSARAVHTADQMLALANNLRRG